MPNDGGLWAQGTCRSRPAPCIWPPRDIYRRRSDRVIRDANVNLGSVSAVAAWFESLDPTLRMRFGSRNFSVVGEC